VVNLGSHVDQMTGPASRSLADVKHIVQATVQGTAELTLPSQKPEKVAHRISKTSREEAKDCSKEESEAGDIVKFRE
jgi:hypothetical protein